MEFNSHVFLLLFLPLLLFSIQLLPNFVGILLLLASLLFYSWNSIAAAIILSVSVVLVHFTRKRSNIYLKFIAAFVIILPFLFYRTSSHFVSLFPSLAELQSIYPEALVLPAGISFYTFQLIGFLFDKSPATCTLQESFLFASYFPQLIAGPIERASDLIDQFRSSFNSFRFNLDDVFDGFKLIGLGLFLKTFFADILSTFIPFNSFDHGLPFVILFAVKLGNIIYFDFLGYSLMAIGLSKMFSISLTLNFARPYASLFVDEFWRRWHITLTTWFKDYVYKPFCRLFEFSASATVIGAIIVFTFTGLWHGFGLRFLIWSSVHCILVLVSKLSKRRLNLDSPRLVRYAMWASVFLSVNFLWVLFFYDLSDSLYVYKSAFHLVFSQELNIKLVKYTALLFPMTVVAILFDPSVLLDRTSLERYLMLSISREATIASELSIRFSQKIKWLLDSSLFIPLVLYALSMLFFSYSKTFVYFQF